MYNLLQVVRISVSIAFGSANGYMLAGTGRWGVVYVLSALWWDGAVDGKSHSTAHTHEPLACPVVLCQANIQLIVVLLSLHKSAYTACINQYTLLVSL